MSSKHNGVNWNKSSKSKQRRKSVIERLKAQLKLGKKTITVEKKVEIVPLSEKDVNRINKELEVLETRI